MRSTIRSGLARVLCATLLAAGAAVVAPVPEAQAFVTDPTRLGAFSGAMRFCEERYGGSERRYKFARLRTASAISDMDSREKLRAIGARDRAYEGGHYLGNKLDERECKALLRLSEWKMFTD